MKSKQHKFKMHMRKLLMWECVFVWSDRLFPQHSAKRLIRSLVVWMLQPAILLVQFRHNIITSFKHGLPRPFFRGCHRNYYYLQISVHKHEFKPNEEANKRQDPLPHSCQTLPFFIRISITKVSLARDCFSSLDLLFQTDLQCLLHNVPSIVSTFWVFEVELCSFPVCH